MDDASKVQEESATRPVWDRTGRDAPGGTVVPC